jgi:ketosteroid isomerase-like protein
MKTKHFIASTATLMACLWTLAFPSFADEAADHAALKALVAEYEEAVAKGDPAALEPHLAPGFSGVMITGEEVENFAALEAYWNKIQRLLGEGGKYTVKVNVAAPATIVADNAFAHGTTDDKAVTSDGNEYQWEGFWTAVCVRDGDTWKILRVHGSMDSVTNTFVATAVKRAAVGGAVVGGIVGLLIGAVAIWLLGRRRRSIPAVQPSAT